MNRRRRATAAIVAQRKKRKLLRTGSRTIRIYRSGTREWSRFAFGKPCSNTFDSSLTLCLARLRMEAFHFMAQQVFFDPRQARWERVRRFFDILGVRITGLILFFVFTALRSGPLS